MNSPKEKAKQLFDKFMRPIDGWHKYPMCFDTSKQCAIIAVEEIIKETDTYYDALIASERKLYWQQVKTEIENL